jgi:hypothetical protein
VTSAGEDEASDIRRRRRSKEHQEDKTKQVTSGGEGEASDIRRIRRSKLQQQVALLGQALSQMTDFVK